MRSELGQRICVYFRFRHGDDRAIYVAGLSGYFWKLEGSHFGKGGPGTRLQGVELSRRIHFGSVKGFRSLRLHRCPDLGHHFVGNLGEGLGELADIQVKPLIKEFQRYYATKMYSLASPGVALSFTLGQPWYGNRGVYRGYTGGSTATETYPLEWYDASKKTG